MNLASVDYIIVGGGSAGCVLAARLSENANCQVMLIEAGGGGPQSVDPYSSWLYQNHGRPFDQLDV